MSVESQINNLEAARNQIRSKMVSAGQASSTDTLSTLAENLTFYTAGDGIDITDNEISTERMTSDEISDLNIVTPGQPSGLVYDFRGTEMVVGKVIEADGTEKPMYQKVVDCGALPNASEKKVPHGINNLSRVIDICGYVYRSTDGISGNLPFVSTLDTDVMCYITGENLAIRTSSDLSKYDESYAILRYTKTT